MRETALDVLLYLFQSYVDGDYEVEPDRAALEKELRDAGFPHQEIDKAFDWLDDLTLRQAQPPHSTQPHRSLRVYSAPEMAKLDTECRGFLIYLEGAGVINGTTRELILDRVMALDSSDIDLERLKWIILMVLFNQPGEDIAYDFIENMVFENAADTIH